MCCYEWGGGVVAGLHDLNEKEGRRGLNTMTWWGKGEKLGMVQPGR